MEWTTFARDAVGAKLSYLTIAFSFAIENEGSLNLRGFSHYEIRDMEITQDRNSLVFTTSLPRFYSIETHEEIQLSENDTYVLQWKVNKKTGKFIEVFGTQEVIDKMADLELAEFKRERLASVATGATELPEVDELKNSLTSRINTQVTGLWNAFYNLWIKPDSDFSLVDAGFQSKEDVQQGVRVVERTIKNDDADLRQKLNNYVKFEAEVPAEATEFQDTTWTRTLSASFDDATRKPLYVLQDDQMKLDYTIKGQQRFFVRLDTCLYSFNWAALPNNQYDFPEEAWRFCVKASDHVTAMIQKYPVIERQRENLLKTAFSACDEDSSGSISSSELSLIFEKLGRKPVESEIKMIIKSLDQDGNGTIEWNEFRTYFLDNTDKSDKLKLFFNFGMLEGLNVSGNIWKVGGDSSKWTNKFIKHWQKRFAILDTRLKTLSYYSSEHSGKSNSKANGVIPLIHYAEVKEAAQRKGGFDFELIPKTKGGQRTFAFSCDTAAERSRWMESINRILFSGSDGFEAVGLVHQAVESILAEPITPPMTFSGHLDIKIFSASNLPATDSLPDPFLILGVGEDEKLAKTKSISKTVSPTWNEEFEVDLVKCRALEFKVKDHNLLDILSKNTDIAFGSFLFANLSQKRETQTIVYLSPQGSVHVHMSIPHLNRESSQDGLFGVSIQSVADREGREFPLIVEKIIKELERRDCLSETGIYRLSGSAKDIKALKDLLNANVAGTDLTSIGDMNTLTGVLKLYFRELPVPLFTYESYAPLVALLAANVTDQERQDGFKRVISGLPGANQDTIIFLFNHLEKVAQLAHVNMMGLRNIATCFAPSILQPPPTENTHLGMGFDVSAQMGVVEALLKAWPKITF